MPPVLDKNRCIGCGACVFICGQYVFDFVPESGLPKAARAADCVTCFMCEDACSAGAITVKVKVRQS